jgi:DNA-binding CsgD family transcriptional regulator
MAAWTQHSNGLGALTQRQRDVLRLIADGRTNPEIAGLLGVSLAGAKWHVSEVISRLGVETREEAAEVWREENSLPRRFTTLMRGLAGLTTLKVVAGSAAASIVAATGIGAFVVIRDSGADAEDPPVVAARQFPNAIYSGPEAAAVGRQLAMEVIASDPWVASLTFKSRKLEPSDLRLSDANFFEDSTFGDVGMPGLASEFPAGEDVWTIEFRADGFDSPASSSLELKVMFGDAKSTLWRVGWTSQTGRPSRRRLIRLAGPTSRHRSSRLSLPEANRSTSLGAPTGCANGGTECA